MRRIKVIVAVVATMAMMLAAGPASANDWNDRHGWNDWNDRHGSWGWGVPEFDVDFENVRNRSDRAGECFVADIDWDGWISEWEIVCYY